MTVIAWDGTSLAADKQCTMGYLKYEVTKIFRIDENRVVAFAGNQSECLMLLDWYRKGEDPTTWPSFQKKDNYSRIISAEYGVLYYREENPVKIRFEGKNIAFGSGNECAMGAMAAGATAKEAVEIANIISEGCGFGVDSFDCKPF